MTSDGNLDLYEGMKSTGMVATWVITKILILIPSKDNQLFNAKIITMHCGV